MPIKLKVDFHTHTADDPYEKIDHNAFQLIDKAQELGFEALAITNHEIVVYNQDLADYANRQGIILIPGTEAKFSNKHVLIINPGFKKAPPDQSLEYLREIKNPSSLIIAPHPFFPGSSSLKSDLFQLLPLFDGVEFSHFYNHLINCNKKGAELAHLANLPLIGSSDCHFLSQLGKTYSLVEADNKDMISIIKAVKEGKIEIHSQPLSLFSMAKIAFGFFYKRKFKSKLR